MTTDLVVVPGTGEAIALNAPSEALAQALDEVRELERELRVAKQAVGAELLRRMDTQAKWTMRTDNYEVRGESPAPRTEYDVEQLMEVLDGLVNEGLLSSTAASAATTTTVSYRVSQRGVNALLKLGGEVAARIAACAQEVERVRKPPSVKPTKGRTA